MYVAAQLGMGDAKLAHLVPTKNCPYVNLPPDHSPPLAWVSDPPKTLQAFSPLVVSVNAAEPPLTGPLMRHRHHCWSRRRSNWRPQAD